LIEQSDKPISTPLDYEPELFYWLSSYIEAFYTLSSSRSSGFSVGAIPLTEIQAWIEIFEIDDREVFVKYIRALDNTFLEHHSKSKSKENQQKLSFKKKR